MAAVYNQTETRQGKATTPEGRYFPHHNYNNDLLYTASMLASLGGVSGHRLKDINFWNLDVECTEIMHFWIIIWLQLNVDAPDYSFWQYNMVWPIKICLFQACTQCKYYQPCRMIWSRYVCVVVFVTNQYAICPHLFSLWVVLESPIWLYSHTTGEVHHVSSTTMLSTSILELGEILERGNTMKRTPCV